MGRKQRLLALADQRATVDVGYCHPDDVDGFFANALVDLFREGAPSSKRLRHRISVCGGPRIASARNRVVRAFLSHDSEWLYCTDADMVFEADIIERLLGVADAAERPFVSGLYFLGGKTNKVTPAMYRLVPGPAIEPILEWPESALVAVDAVGAGAMLIHRSVFEAVGEKWQNRSAFPWFAETETETYKEWGEDITFCLRVRDLGIPIHVHTGLVVPHRKRHLLGYEEFASHQARQTLGLEAA